MNIRFIFTNRIVLLYFYNCACSQVWPRAECQIVAEGRQGGDGRDLDGVHGGVHGHQERVQGAQQRAQDRRPHPEHRVLRAGRHSVLRVGGRKRRRRRHSIVAAAHAIPVLYLAGGRVEPFSQWARVKQYFILFIFLFFTVKLV